MKRTTLLVFALAIGISAPAFGTVAITETFDNDPASRGWAGVNNINLDQNYGFSPDDVTGSAVNPPGGTATAGGEFGGRLDRQNPTWAGGEDNFYGVSLGGTLEIPGLDISTDAFSVSGVIHLQERHGTSGFYMGYSRGVASYTDDINFELGDAKNFIGIQFDDTIDGIGIVFSSTGGRDRDLDVPNLVDGTTVPFSMDYDPNGNGFNGALATSINGVAHTFNLPGGVKNDVDVLTHFGIMPVSADGDFGIIWIDDLTYTAVSGGPLTGDLDCDGDTDFDDIDDFVLGLNNPTLYQSNFGVPPAFKGDTDGDGDLDFDDIPGFVSILSGGGTQAIPEPTGVALVVAGSLTLLVARRRRWWNSSRRAGAAP